MKYNGCSFVQLNVLASYSKKKRIIRDKCSQHLWRAFCGGGKFTSAANVSTVVIRFITPFSQTVNVCPFLFCLHNMYATTKLVQNSKWKRANKQRNAN